MQISLYVFCAALIMMTIEAFLPGRLFPRVAYWWLRALLFNAIQAAIIVATGYFFDGWLANHRLWNADVLGTLGGIAVGYFVHSFVYYWWHRARHESPWLWRWLHRFHHAPQRIEIITSFYKHPLEIVANSLLSSAVLYLGVGLSPRAVAGVFLVCGLAELFYHWNVSTPHWVGYLIQRPESHCLHHQEGVHRFNYGDLPLFDMLFGTFRNPLNWAARTGFGSQSEGKLKTFLLGRPLETENSK